MRIKNLLVAGATMCAISLAMAAPTMALTCPSGSIRSSANTLAECNVEADDSLMPTIKTIIYIIIGVLGLAAVVVIVLGGVSYTTSAGDPGKVKKAKDTIMYGLIGLVVALLSWAIVNFVLSSILGGTGGGGGGGGGPVPSST